MIKVKIIYYLISFLTLGLYPLYLKKKVNSIEKNELSTSKKITVDIDKLKEFLGGPSNIIGAEYTHTKIRIFCNNIDKLKIDEIQKLKSVSGIFKTSKDITLLVGTQAKLIANQLIKNL